MKNQAGQVRLAFLLVAGVLFAPFAGCQTAPPRKLTAVVSAPQVFTKPSDQPTVIRIQIMDSRSHRPLKGRRVIISFTDVDGRWLRKPPTSKGRTGSDGVVSLEVKRPVPPRIGVFIWWVYPCTDQGDFSTQEVLADGLVAHWTSSSFKKVEKWCTAELPAPQPHRQPGKLIIFVHPMNRLVWSWYNTWR